MTGTLAEIIPNMEALIGNKLERILTDAGYRGHNASPDYKLGSTPQARSGV